MELSLFIALSSSVEIYHLLSHIFRTESVKYNENYTRAAKRPEVIIRIIWTDEVRNIWASHPSSLPFYGVFLLPVYCMASKSHRSIMGLRDLGTRSLCVYPGPLYCFFRGFRLSVGVKKWFEALTGKFLPFVVSYISHFICSYNPNYNFRPLRGPSIILIMLLVWFLDVTE